MTWCASSAAPTCSAAPPVELELAGTAVAIAAADLAHLHPDRSTLSAAGAQAPRVHLDTRASGTAAADLRAFAPPVELKLTSTVKLTSIASRDRRRRPRVFGRPPVELELAGTTVAIAAELELAPA